MLPWPGGQIAKAGTLPPGHDVEPVVFAVEHGAHTQEVVGLYEPTGHGMQAFAGALEEPVFIEGSGDQ